MVPTAEDGDPARNTLRMARDGRWRIAPDRGACLGRRAAAARLARGAGCEADARQRQAAEGGNEEAQAGCSCTAHASAVGSPPASRAKYIPRSYRDCDYAHDAVSALLLSRRAAGAAVLGSRSRVPP